MIKTAMARETRVRDVMTSSVVAVPFSSTVSEAGSILHTASVSGAPVISSSGRVLGVVSRTDLVDPRHSHADDAAVADVMTRIVFAVRADDPLVWAIRLMVDEHVHRVVVTDDHGTLVGILVPMDVLRAMVPNDAPGAHEVGFKYVDLRR